MVKRVVAQSLVLSVLAGGVIWTQTRDAPVRVGGPVPAPKRVKYVQPIAAKLQSSPSIVVLELLLDPAGNVAEAKPLRGEETATKAAVAAVKQWAFEPVTAKGQKVWALLVSTVEVRSDSTQAARAERNGIVRVNSGVNVRTGEPASLISLEAENRITEAYLVVHATDAATLQFEGPASLLSEPGSHLVVIAKEKAWEFVTPRTTLAENRPRAETQRLAIRRVEVLPVTAGVSHSQLLRRWLRN